MKLRNLLIYLLFIASVCSAQTIASRRYGEKTVESYHFGPMTALAPYNNQPDYLTNSFIQIQPSGFVNSNNNCASTGSWNVITQTSPAATFSVSSNTCTVATGSSGGTYLLADSNSSFTYPLIFTYVKFTVKGGYNFGPMISNAAGTVVLTAAFINSSTCALNMIISGTSHNIGGATCSPQPGAGSYVGLSLVGNDACFWYSTDGISWNAQAGCASTSTYYNFETPGNLNGFEAGVYLSGSSTTWSFQNMISGGFGGVGVRDISLVTKADGTPYMSGTVAYFTGTTCDPYPYCYDGVYSLDLSTNPATLTEIGAILNTRSSAYAGDSASHLIYDPGANEYRYFTSGWDWVQSGYQGEFYGAWAPGTFNPLAGGIGAVAATTEMTFGSSNSGWDFHVACTAWNYSAGTCGKWTGALAHSLGQQYAAYTTSDPSSNSWTNIATPTFTAAEADRVTRSATGSGGVLYEIAFLSALGSASNNLTWPTYSSSSFTSVGTLTAQRPGGVQNGPHPQIFSYGNNEYLVTFNDVIFGNNQTSAAQTMGNFLIASTPKYSAQTTYPQFVGSVDSGAPNSSSAASATTSLPNSTMSVTAGDLVTVFCRGATTTITSVAASSSLSMGSFTGIGFNLTTSGGTGTGWDEGFYVYATASGTSSFTCTPNASSTYLGVVAMDFHPGNLTTVDYTTTMTQKTGTTLFTTPSFSTTAAGLIVVCANALVDGTAYANGSLVPGFIGPYAAGAAAAGYVQGYGCMSLSTPASQSSITATVGWLKNASTTMPDNWSGAVMSFK